MALAVTKVGTESADRLGGTSGDEEGQDALFGRGGDDRLNGRSAADILAGDAGNDTLNGGAGNDTLDGGPGNDTLFMGAGIDYVNARDGEVDTIDCGNQGGYYILFDPSVDRFVNCPPAGSSTASTASAAPAAGQSPSEGVLISTER